MLLCSLFLCDVTSMWALLLDSLGQCVSALSKRFATAETFRDAVSSIPYSHREKRSEIRHRKDHVHHKEDHEDNKVRILLHDQRRLSGEPYPGFLFQGRSPSCMGDLI